MAKLREQ
jgi:integrase